MMIIINNINDEVSLHSSTKPSPFFNNWYENA